MPVVSAIPMVRCLSPSLSAGPAMADCLRSRTENIMRSATLIGLLILLSISLCPSWVSADMAQDPLPEIYSRATAAARGLTLSSSRGIAFALDNDELEAARTKELTLGIELKPNVLQLRIPFGSYEVDTSGDLLPRGSIRAKSIGAAFWLSFGGERWTPFIGAGGSFHSFEEMFMTMGNLENTFGADLYTGLRFRLVENLWDRLKLRWTLRYQVTLLKPGVQIPEHMDTTEISMHRHGITLALEVIGL